MKKIASTISGFIKAHKLLFAIILISIMLQFLIGVTAWKIAAVALTLVLIGWVGSQHRTVGKILFWIFAGLWIYHMVTTEFSEQFPLTDKMKDYAQREKDVDMAEEIAPELVGTRQALIQKKLSMQNNYGTKIAEANSKDEIEKLNNAQFEETRWYDKEIKRVDDLIKEIQKKEETPAPVNIQNVKQEIQPEEVRQTETSKIYFRAKERKTTYVKVKPGDKVRYRDVRGVFRIESDDGTFSEISNDQNHEAYAEGRIRLQGMTNGEVTIIVIPKN